MKQNSWKKTIKTVLGKYFKPSKHAFDRRTLNYQSSIAPNSLSSLIHYAILLDVVLRPCHK